MFRLIDCARVGSDFKLQRILPHCLLTRSIHYASISNNAGILIPCIHLSGAVPLWTIYGNTSLYIVKRLGEKESFCPSRVCMIGYLSSEETQFSDDEEQSVTENQ